MPAIAEADDGFFIRFKISIIRFKSLIAELSIGGEIARIS